ncbi:autotransporter secretion inner membrane protein TamB [Roseovarius marisflavi]|uniref:Autotransporter secretion inner membrane protein TamB n=1 Tax=Roseovarius marisflavi TaxID=1054996 RepID=A0A1M6VJK0_9RHOB|nr:translocation/assembly module TamB domain-containing protein [Roseovarius marisflavi]SHK81426.1 autotransporter secretion inner membrane protein TamB [Roseovarius marisflavi]
MRFLLIITVLLSSLATPLLAQSEDEDRGYLQGLIEDSLSGAGRVVRITGFKGALSSQATVEELSIADDAGVWLTLRDVTLDWTRSALLAGRIEVNRLSAGEIDLPRLPNTQEDLSPEMAEAKPFALPELPVSVNIGEISAETVTLGAPILGQKVTLRLTGALSLGSGEGEAQLDVTRLDERGALTLIAGYANETQVLALDLKLREDEGGIASTLLNLPDSPSIALSISGEAPLSDYTAEINLSSSGEPRLEGTVNIRADGPPDAMKREFSAVLAGDLTPLLPAEYRPFFGPDSQLVLQGVREASGALDISDVNLSAAQLQLGGSLSLDAEGWPTTFALAGQLGDGTTPVRLPISGPATQLMSAVIDARFDAARGDRWRANVTLSELAQPDLSIASASLSGRGAIRRVAPRGVSALSEFSISGLALSDPALAEAAGDALSGHAMIDWAEGKPLRILGLRVLSGGARLSGRASIDNLADGFPVSGEARLEAPDLARFAALAGQDIAGQASAEISGSGSLLGGDFDIEIGAETRDLALGVTQLDPLLTSPGTLTLSAKRDTTGTDLRSLVIKNDALRATATGRLNSKSGALTLAARLGDLALADRRLSGPAETSVNVAWQTGGDVTLTGLEAELMGATINTTASLTPDAPGLPARGNLAAEISDLSRFNAISGQRLRGTATLTLVGNATVQDQSFDITTSLDGENIGTGIAELDRLIAGQIALTAKAARTPERIEIENLSVETPQLSLKAEGEGGDSPVNFSARLANLGLFAPDFSGPVAAEGNARLIGPDARQIALAMNAQGPGGTTAQVDGDIHEHGQRLDLAARGALPLALINGMIKPNALLGTARYDLRVNGAPGLAAVSGTVTTDDTRIALPGTGLGVDNLSGTVTLANQRAETDFTAAMRDGGQIRINGPVGLTGGFNGDLAIALAGLVVSDQEIYRATVNGSVTVVGPMTGGAMIGGTLNLEETNIRIPSGLGANSVTLPGLRHISEPAEVRATRRRAGLIAVKTSGGVRPFGLNLQINAPSRIFVRGRGLDAELGGRLRLAGTTNAVEPEGVFQLIRGRLDILGKRLDLTDGLVNMQGALDPYIRFVAETTAEDVTVMIVVEGLASAPEISFTSEPDLPEEEVVARLLFGRGLDTISPFQAAQMASAIATLSGRSSLDVVGTLRGAVGLSDLDVTQTEDGDTEVSAGAYISDKFYSEVIADSTGKQQINLNYDLTNSITLKGGASNEGNSGIGVFFEKDY